MTYLDTTWLTLLDTTSFFIFHITSYSLWLPFIFPKSPYPGAMILWWYFCFTTFTSLFFLLSLLFLFSFLFIFLCLKFLSTTIYHHYTLSTAFFSNLILHAHLFDFLITFNLGFSLELWCRALRGTPNTVKVVKIMWEGEQGDKK